MYRVLLLTGGLIFGISSCETEYIPENPDRGMSLLAREGNFRLAIHIAGYGEADTLPATRNMEPETEVIKVKDDLYVQTTLAVDPTDSASAVTTRAFQVNARIRVVAYAVTAGPDTIYTEVFDEIYDVQSNSILKRESSTDLIDLPVGDYKLVAYSYNDAITPPPGYASTITDIDPSNDLIWGVSPTVSAVEGSITDITIPVYHKLSQVKLVATTGSSGPNITAINGVTLSGYTVNLTTLDGTLAKNTAISQAFNFPTLNVATVNANTRTVYTGTPGDMPTIIHVGSLSVNNGTTLNDFAATFAKSLQSGYSYTMTMRIGNNPDLTDDIPAGFITYVGAFWQADQTGERLIHLPRMSDHTIDSVWTAQVIQGRDWILLDTLMTTDPNVGWRNGGVTETNVDDANDPNFEANAARQLTPPTASTFVSGFVSETNGQIYFRIGLKDQYTPTPDKPARYGIVLLTYGNNKYRNRIWIRQGEEADYVMRNSDPVNSGGLASRTECMPFSPYNLTAPETLLNGPVRNTYGFPPSTDPPAIFTAYPTQAGAIFQWANEVNKRYAYAPIGTVSGWQDGYANVYWSDAPVVYVDNPVPSGEEVYETCPDGYARPTDGPTNASSNMSLPADMAQSEIRQSLWLNPQAGSNVNNTTNSSWGYYADGFFDRRLISTTTFSTANSSVSINYNVAYVGRMFFNPNSYASLFFPATGHRLHTNGNFDVVSNYDGRYWTSSSVIDETTTDQRAWNLCFTGNIAYQSNFAESYGESIRCVYNPCVTIGSVTLTHSGSSSIGIGSRVILTASVTPNNSHDITYRWEFWDGFQWHFLANTNANTYKALIPYIGENHYRVTAKNKCSSISSEDVIIAGISPTIPEDNPNVPEYVGAFWKANQTGERVIRISVGAAGLGNSGNWLATVSWLDNRWGVNDGVVLAAGPSPDVNIRTNNPGDAESYQVPGNVTTISGTAVAGGYIEFRIGLKTAYTASAAYPARYGVVLLAYGDDKWRRIFIRQGQDADYLMRPGDPDGNGRNVADNRSYAVKISPYNLKDPQHRIQDNRSNTPLSVNGGTFTDYPSMVGYLFAFNKVLIAMPPINQFTISGWNQNTTGTTAWWSAASHETCPNNVARSYGGTANFRRPTDGTAVNAVGANTVAGSEIRQSLWLNPKDGISVSDTTNSVGGFYADGYFDRGLINLTNSITGPGLYTVAYNHNFSPAPFLLNTATLPPGAAVNWIFLASSGRLFYNPVTNASVFFPAGGQNTNGVNSSKIDIMGELGGYWTSTHSSTFGGNVYGNSFSLYFPIEQNANSSQVVMYASQGSLLNAVRCVTVTP